MKTVWKYVLYQPGLNIIKMPAGAEILHIGMQDDRPCAWVFVDSENELQERLIHVFGTGWEMGDVPNNKKHLGTAQTNDSLVWHVFEGGSQLTSTGESHG